MISITVPNLLKKLFTFLSDGQIGIGPNLLDIGGIGIALTILLFLPRDKNTGIVLRNKGYTESVISSSEYLIDEKENLNIKTIYNSTVSEEKICFLSTHIRSRYSVIRNQVNNAVIQTSHTSEIRNISILKDWLFFQIDNLY